MCYIRPDLFKKLMEHIGVPVDNDERLVCTFDSLY